MNASYEWLKEFVDLDLTPTELRDLITSRVATVDAIEPLRTDLEPIVVARVVEAAPHPDSTHLTVTKVDAGSDELLDVVCGAPNVRAGAMYPFAPVGTIMPGGLKIERRKIRGAVSQGMLCSARELGLGQDHEGVLELQVSVPPGTPLLSALPTGDVRLDIDVSPVRPDLQSQLGIAREVAAATGRPLRIPPIPAAGGARTRAGDVRFSRGTRGVSTDDVPVTIDDITGCPRYLAAAIRGVRIAPSPPWLVERLAAVGVRAINNVVDATNYMLHGFGQPMHAFDLARLGGPAIVVRRARSGERLVTLDGVARALDPSMLVIADATDAQALAGIIGGAGSEVSDGTTDILLEVAAFDPATVRATRRRLGLSTDASYRFERGTDVASADRWLAQAVELITAIAGGGLAGPVADVYPTPAEAVERTVRVSRVERLLGAPVPAREIVQLVGSVGFEPRPTAGAPRRATGEPDELRFAVPSWRRDIDREVDLIEEVARLRGYESFPDEIRPYRPGTVPDHPLHIASRRVREALVAAGLLETRPLPFVAGAEAHVRVANPIAESEAYMRRDLLESLARRAEYNLSHMVGDVRLFEVGAAFAPGEHAGALPREEMRAAALIMGRRRPPHFTEKEPPPFDEWDARWLGELLGTAARPSATVELRAAEGGEVLWEMLADGAPIGRVQRVALDAPVWAAPAFGVEVTIATVESTPVAPAGRQALGGWAAADGRRAPAFRALPTTPAVERDLAVLVPDAVAAGRVADVVRTAAGELLERLELLEEYRGEKVAMRERSLLWRLTFRDPQRTLRDKEVEGRLQRVVRSLEGELGVRQRTT